MRQPAEFRPRRPPEWLHRGSFRAIGLVALALSVCGLPALAAGSHSAAANWGGDSGARRVVNEQNGTVAIHDGDRVRVSLEVGDVHVRTQASGSVQYRLRIETPEGAKGRQPSAPPFHLTARSGVEGAVITGRAERGRSYQRFWVSLELDVPRGTPLEVSPRAAA